MQRAPLQSDGTRRSPWAVGSAAQEAAGAARRGLSSELQLASGSIHRDCSGSNLRRERGIDRLPSDRSTACTCSGIASCSMYARSLAVVLMRWRATGQQNVPACGRRSSGLQSCQLSGRFFCGISVAKAAELRGAIDFVRASARSRFIRSVGGFPIQREGIGASGMKETLRRLKAGGIVALFPEGTRSPDGELGPLKPGIAVLAARVGVPVVPAGVAGLYRELAAVEPPPGAPSCQDSLMDRRSCPRAGRPRCRRDHRADPEPHAGKP